MAVHDDGMRLLRREIRAKAEIDAKARKLAADPDQFAKLATELREVQGELLMVRGFNVNNLDAVELAQLADRKARLELRIAELKGIYDATLNVAQTGRATGYRPPPDPPPSAMADVAKFVRDK